MSTDISPKAIWISIFAIIIVFFLIFTKGNPKNLFSGLGGGDNTCATNSTCVQNVKYQTIGDCRECLALKDLNVPYAKDIGEYADWRLTQKLATLASLNTTWRVTEAYPPTVKHLSFCHYNGTCVDIGLFASQRTAANLSQLCEDALTAGFTVLNEYSDTNLSSSGSSCPDPNVFETTTGGNLHLSE